MRLIWLVTLCACALIARAAVNISGNAQFSGSLQIGGNGFNPMSVPGLILWVDINRQSLLDNTNINPIIDYSSNAANLNQITDTHRATNFVNQINGYAAARFDGADDSYTGGAWTTNQQYTIQAVFRFANTGAVNQVLLCHGSTTTTGTRMMYNVGQRCNNHRGAGGGGSDNVMNDGAATTNFECWSFRRTSAPLVTAFVNRTNVSLSNANTAMNNPSGSPLVGQFEVIGLFFDGYLAEIRVWDNDIGSDNEQASIQQLCNKYNLP